jgi:hypothetical protein
MTQSRRKATAPRHERVPESWVGKEKRPLRQDLATPQHDARDEADDAVRRCALTRERLPKEDLIRFVLAPSGEIVPDLKERLPGRRSGQAQRFRPRAQDRGDGTGRIGP